LIDELIQLSARAERIKAAAAAGLESGSKRGARDQVLRAKAGDQTGPGRLAKTWMFRNP